MNKKRTRNRLQTLCLQRMNRSKWEYKKLGEVATFIGGGTPSKANEEYYTGNIPWATVRDMTNFYLSKTELCITEQAVKESATNIIPKDTIIISTHVGLGKICLLNQDTAINQDLKGVILPPTIDKMYFASWYKSISDYIVSNGKGATVKGVTMKFVNDLNIPLPPIADQQRIVAELDCLNEMIAVKQEQLKEFDKLAQSIFYDMFGDPVANEKGWEKNKLDDLYKVTSSKRILQSEWQDNGVPFYKVADIVNLIGGKAVVPSTFIKKSTYNELMRQGLVPNSGDVLITSRGTLGECYIVLEGDKFYFQDGMITWLSQKTNNILPIYLKSVFGTKSFLDSLLHNANMSTVAYLSIGQLSKVKVPLPPLSLQQQFAEKISAIEAQKELVKQSIAETQKLLDYTMDKYFGYD